jgi:hypothetical protein
MAEWVESAEKKLPRGDGKTRWRLLCERLVMRLSRRTTKAC